MMIMIIIYFKTNNIIFFHNIGYYQKNGRLLLLSEAHNLICNSCYVQYVHHPENDVILRTCLYNYIITKNSCVNYLLKKCSNPIKLYYMYYLMYFCCIQIVNINFNKIIILNKI